MSKTLEALMVDDDAGDVRLTQEALKAGKVQARMSVCVDGQDCLDYLRGKGKYAAASRPDVIFLDLNMPRMNGHETLKALKSDPALSDIPVVILTTSDADSDILAAYRGMASTFVTKPVDLPKFRQVIQDVGKYWADIARTPPRRK